MLETVDTLAWQTIVSDPRVANDVPRLLKSIPFFDAETGAQAVEEVLGYMDDQGTFFEVTPAIVPCLLEILGEDTVQCRSALLSALTLLVAQCVFFQEKVVGDDLEERSWWVEDDLPAAYLQQQRRLVEHVSEALQQGLDLYLRLLIDDDPAIRMEIPYLLRMWGQHAPSIMSFGLARLQQETHPQVKASLLLYLGTQERFLSTYEPLLKALVEAPGEPVLVSVVAALVHAQYRQEQTPEATQQVLLEALIPSEEREKLYGALPWSRWSQRSLLTAVCEAIHPWAPSQPTRCLFPLLETLTALNQRFERLHLLHPLNLFDVLTLLVSLAFQREGLPVNRIPFGLTTMQTRVLLAIVNSPIVLHWNQDVSTFMIERGFPPLWKLRLLLLGDASCLPSAEREGTHVEENR